MTDTLSRFEDKYVVCPTGCWVWMGCKLPRGYGRFWKDGGMRLAHRVAYELFTGPIPDGLQLDHLCRVPGCVNPAHLEAVTHAENVRRGDRTRYNADKTHCPQGHPYDEENTFIYSDGRRECRICNRRRSLSYYHRTKDLK